MTTRIKLVTLFLLLAVAATTMWAQPRGGGRGFADPDETVAMLKKELSLDKKQEKEVLAIVTRTQEQIRKARNESDGDRFAMMEIIREKTGEMEKKIEGLLDAGQKKKYKEQREKVRAEREKRMRDNPNR